MGVNEKAERLARAGRVSDLVVDGEFLSATVEGDSGTYRVNRDPEGWRCECPAFEHGHRMCSHIGAAGLYERWGEVYDSERAARERMARRGRIG